MRESAIGPWLVLVAVLLATSAGAEVGDEATAPEPAVEGPAEPVDLYEGDPLFDEALAPAGYGSRDPFEDWNRDVFSFNRRMDAWVFDPVTNGYRYVVPEPGRRAVHRASLNLDTPVVLANHMLQLRVVEAAGTLTRFVINSSLGVAGLFDPAADVLHVPRIDADFGQTLARYGSPSGPYLMLPVFGPSTARDVFGNVVDIIADPLSYLLGPLQWWTLALGGSEGLIAREASLDDLHRLEKGSVDFYAALRSAYLQSRDAAAREARGATGSADIVMLAD